MAGVCKERETGIQPSQDITQSQRKSSGHVLSWALPRPGPGFRAGEQKGPVQARSQPPQGWARRLASWIRGGAWWPTAPPVRSGFVCALSASGDSSKCGRFRASHLFPPQRCPFL